jgi:dipeptidyl aminopeptidase/acylaminoacyl peptidase
MSDRSGFWNLYKYEAGDIHLLLPQALEQEFGGPAWTFGKADYRPFQSDPTKLLCKNKSSLAVLDVTAKTLTDLPTPFRGIGHLSTASYNGEEIGVFLGISSDKPAAVVSYNVTEKKVVAYLKDSSLEPLDEAYVSASREIRFPTKLGDGYCYFYPPKNPEFQSEGLPPVIVLSHGGPTSNCDGSYNRSYLYWTSRGFAIADVNYGGSTGYGRDYRNRLQKNWGIVDVNDCCDAALYLAEQGYVDREKLIIRGGSAGGYTTL